MTATLSLIAQLYKDRLEIATNASVVTEALAAVERMKQDVLSSERGLIDQKVEAGDNSP